MNNSVNLSASILKIAQEELGEDDHKKAQTLELLRDWLKSQDHIKNCRQGK